jgi:hypothetical protein
MLLETRMKENTFTLVTTPELPSTISVISLLVDAQGNLMDRCPSIVDVNGDGVVPESVVMGMIHAQRHQRPDKRRFQLADIVTYFVPVTLTLLDWTRSSTLVHNDGSWMKTLPAIPMDIVVPPSLFIFHSIQSIWLIFREEVCVGHTSTASLSPSLSPPLAISILKKPPQGSAAAATTTKSNKKHVRISQELPRYKSMLLPKRKMTMKRNPTS